ncbi:Importin-beta N-terminal domain containing protein [Nitzschia inconspicua]|uniref:Importin-beta N-terminal domain containing protein n=1 Tax=Nitzschia inconspicua TaxID=303405 RepID=A0A9K3PEK9_9STRA|nr:Importin-beta N-terminal domain containing protein [Nitzschia inconspicua]
MDVEKLHVVLQQSFSPDVNLRGPAEETIRNLKHIKGATIMLLQVAAEKQVQFEVRQAAAIQLKNICRECWAERLNFAGFPLSDAEGKKPPLLDGEDKNAIRPGLVAGLLDEPEKSLRDLLAETLHTIVIHDFPENWPDLIPTLLQMIQHGANDPNQALRVHNALLALRKVCKRYEYKSKEQRGPLNEIVAQAFPLLLPLAQQLSQPDQNTLEAAMMLKQILKIFWSSTQFYLPGGDGTNPSPALTNPQSMQPWLDILQQALVKQLPEGGTGLEPRGQPTAIEERNAWPWWKVKKWAVQIMSRLFSRYGIPSYAEDDAKEFARYFSQNVATQFLGPVCEALNLRPSGQFCTDRVVHLCLTYVDLAVELSSTYKLLKPHLDFLLYQVCFPTMCLTEEDIELFENDPHEFVHRQNSPLADFYDPRMSAITLVTDLVKHRGQDVTLNLLGRMTEILKRYGSSPPETQNHIEKDGALLTFGSLSKFLLAKEKYANEIEGLLVTSVFPDFNSPVGFLRYRACWMVQQFSSVKFTDDGTNLRTLLQLTLQRLSDPALPVQIEASKALRFLIEADGAEQTLLPVLPQLLTEYFRIMNEIGNDEVVSALQVLLDKFGDHIEPHAVQLVTQLSNAFNQYCTAGEDEDDDDAAMAAAQCLECIATVLKGICDQPAMMKSLEPLLIPLVLKIMGNDGEYIEYLECSLDILTFLTYFPDSISPELWQVFPLIYIAFDQWAYDYLNMMVPCLQAYIQKGPDMFLVGKAQMPEGVIPYIDLIVNMVAKTVTNDRASESECRYALSLFMSLLHNCQGKIDQFIPIINEIVLAKLGQQVNSEVPFTRISIYQVLGSALYYNPELEIVELEKRGVTQQVFHKWMEDTKHMERWLPRKLTVLGMSSILAIPAASLPPSIQSSLAPLIDAVVRMSIALKAESEGGEKNIDDENIGDENDLDDEDIGDVDAGFGEDEDVTNEVDESYRKALQGVTSWDDDMAKFLLGGDWDDDREDVDEDFTSPLDRVDELLFLNDTLKAAFQREPEAYQQVQAALPPESVANCQKVFQAADSMRAQATQQSSQQS